MLTPLDAAEKIVRTIQTKESLLIYPWSEAGIMVLLKRYEWLISPYCMWYTVFKNIAVCI